MEAARAIDLTEAGKISQLMERITDVVVHRWLSWMISSLAPVVSNVESWGILRRAALRTGKQPQIPRLSSVAWFTSTPAMSILETGFVLIAAMTILVQVFLETIVLFFLKTILLVFLKMTVLVFLEMILVFVTLGTNPVLTMTLENEPTMYVDSRNGLCVEAVFQRDDDTFLDVCKNDVTFSRCSNRWCHSSCSLFKLKFQLRLSRCCWTT